MASSPITSWQIDGETVETVADLIFLGSRITADGDCSHEIKRHQLLGRRRQWQPTPVFLPGASQGWGSLVGCRLWGRTESDTTEATQQQQQQLLGRKARQLGRQTQIAYYKAETLLDKGPSSQSYGFSSSHVWV